MPPHCIKRWSRQIRSDPRTACAALQRAPGMSEVGTEIVA